MLMKGVVLAGGTGSRLFPLTRVTNKHLLPVYDRPMIFYPLNLLTEMGITDILLVTGGQSAGEFLRLLGNGHEFGCNLMYAYQNQEKGIADALRLAESFAGDDPICVILGDNLFEKSLDGARDTFERKDCHGAHIVLSKVNDPERFGVPVFDSEGKMVSIEEKPGVPNSSYAVTGAYFYDASVFDRIKTLKPSRREELEITDINLGYLAVGELSYTIQDGWWTDAGTFDSLLHANNLIAKRRRVKHGDSPVGENA